MEERQNHGFASCRCHSIGPSFSSADSVLAANWPWIEQVTGLPIADSICDALLSTCDASTVSASLSDEFSEFEVAAPHQKVDQSFGCAFRVYIRRHECCT